MADRTLLLGLLLASCRATGPEYDVVVRGGRVLDGGGGPSYVADVGIRGDRVAAIGDLRVARGRLELDAAGLAVAPGFVNVLSWATESLLVDGRGLSDLAQGVTLEVFGEGWSMGPWNEAMKAEALSEQADLRYDVTWTTLGEYLEHLERRGVSVNVASLVGAATVRIHELGYEDRAPTPDELERMRALVRQAMEEGALGVGSSLIYAPGTFASTEELVALCEVAAEYGGRYFTHIRSEGPRLLEAVDEALAIGRAAGIGVEIYHLKAAGQESWDDLAEVFARVEAARAAGQDVTADVYTYTAGASGLDASMPPWVQVGGREAWIERLRDPQTRARVAAEMREPADDWENLLLASGDAERVLVVGFDTERLKPLAGRTLASIARERGVTPEEAAIDLVVEDGGRVGTVYFLMSEENVERKLARPWVCLGSDAGAPAPEGVFLATHPHPRAYGNFARLLGHYVRERGVLSLEEAVRRLTSLPATNLGLVDRGRLAPGAFADVVVFDPATVADRATYAQPHALATGVRDVLVNGEPALLDGEPTDARPGRFVRGPGAPRRGPSPEGPPESPATRSTDRSVKGPHARSRASRGP